MIIHYNLQSNVFFKTQEPQTSQIQCVMCMMQTTSFKSWFTTPLQLKGYKLTPHKKVGAHIHDQVY